MKTLALAAAICVLVVTACASPDVRSADPKRPQVTVIDGRYIVVDQEPLVFRRSQGSVHITWQLPLGSNYRFPDNGIEIEGVVVQALPKDPKDRKPKDSIVVDRSQDEIVDCRRSNDGLEFTCKNKNSKAGLYKYTIRVNDGNTPLPHVDPHVMND